MEWWFYVPTLVWCLWVFLLGLMVGSFLNVLIARLPYEKSIVWPGSRCFSCYRPIRFLDNLPVVGYLRLGGFVGDGAVLDPQFNTTDVCIVVKTDLISAKYSKHYERRVGWTPGEAEEG